jgi:hypothetical protein
MERLYAQKISKIRHQECDNPLISPKLIHTSPTLAKTHPSSSHRKKKQQEKDKEVKTKRYSEWDSNPRSLTRIWKPWSDIT